MANPNGIIFVVDDDESVRKSLRRLLHSVGLEVETFASGAQFLSRVPPVTCGVVILDLRMPVLNGLDVQHELHVRGAKAPVIFITAHDDDEARETAMARGAVGFVRKPFDQHVLLDLVDHALGKSGESSAREPPSDRGKGQSEQREELT